MAEKGHEGNKKIGRLSIAAGDGQDFVWIQ
jgi:hypothetical protein